MIKKESIYYESRSGKNKIHAVKWAPVGKIKAILIIAHGMSEHIERYDDFASYLAERGILVAGCDYLGHGKTVVGQEKHGYICAHDPATVIVRDVHRLKKIIEVDNPGIPQIVMGHSMGSFVIRNYLCRYGSGVDAAILMGTGMPPKAIILISRILANIQARFIGGEKPAHFLDKMAFGGYNKKIADASSRFSWLSVNSENVEKYEADSLCGFMFSINGFQMIAELLYRLSKPKNVALIPSNLPILLVSGSEDPVGDYVVGLHRVKKSLEKAGVSDITLTLYPWGRHEILHEEEKMEVYSDIIYWLEWKLDINLGGSYSNRET